jgi:hypothetical protein
VMYEAGMQWPELREAPVSRVQKRTWTVITEEDSSFLCPAR